MQNPFMMISIRTEVVTDGGGDGICVHAAMGVPALKKKYPVP